MKTQGWEYDGEWWSLSSFPPTVIDQRPSDAPQEIKLFFGAKLEFNGSPLLCKFINYSLKLIKAIVEFHKTPVSVQSLNFVVLLVFFFFVSVC